MMPAMYAAVSGLEAHQTMLNVVANNLANVDTVGYKSERTSFVDELAETLSAGSGATATNGGTNPMQFGLGVQVGSIDNEMNAGSMETTGNPLDIAIQGDGFITVGGGGGNATTTPPTLPKSFDYTRAGDLTTNAEGVLVTASGQYVMGSAASGTTGPTQYITIPQGATNVSIGQDGGVTYTDPTTQATDTAGYLTLATFQNEAGLNRAGGSLWTASTNSGAATYGTPDTGNFGQTIAGSLEMSNVDMATEFTNMIEAQSGYEANSRNRGMPPLPPGSGADGNNQGERHDHAAQARPQRRALPTEPRPDHHGRGKSGYRHHVDERHQDRRRRATRARGAGSEGVPSRDPQRGAARPPRGTQRLLGCRGAAGLARDADDARARRDDIVRHSAHTRVKVSIARPMTGT